MSWFARLIGKQRLEQELSQELHFHLEQHVRDLVAGGMTPEQARRRARIELGGVEQVKEEARDVRGTRWLEDWWHDTRYALRSMKQAKGFTAAAVLTLAIGIGANTAVFSVVRALLLAQLPVERPSELFLVRVEGPDGPDTRISGPAFQRYREGLKGPARLAAMGTVIRMWATLADAPEAVQGQLVSGEWFSVLGVKPAAGRLLGAEDDVSLGGHPVVVLGDDYWSRRFGRSPSVVGQTIRINGTPLTVVGVAERRFAGVMVGGRTDVYLPLAMQQAIRYAANANNDNADSDKPWFPQEGIRWLGLIGRAGPNEAITSLTARVDNIYRATQATALASADSATRAYESRRHIVLASADKGISDLRDDFGSPLLVLMTTVGLVLVVACANLASLLVARSAARSHEIAVRMSLGARGGRLVRQVLTESVTLAAFGGMASLLVGYWGSKALLVMASGTPGSVPLTLAFDGRLLGFVAGVSLLTGIGFGLAPALRMSRTDLHSTFKSGGRVAGDRRGREWSVGRMLVVAQVALSMVLVVVAAVFVRSAQQLLDRDAGYDRTSVLDVRVDTRAAGYPTEQLTGLYQRLLDGVRAVPGVRSASVSVTGLATSSARSSSVTVPGKVRGPEWNSAAQVGVVSEDFFATTGMQLLKGRSFLRADGPTGPKVAIINETMARRFFEVDDPIGLRFGFDETLQFEVIGLVRDARTNGLKEEVPSMLFLPIAQDMDHVYNLEVRVNGSAATAASALRKAILAVDPALPVREIVTLGDLLERGIQQDRMVSKLTGIFGILAALLAAIGLYGVMSYSVARRTNEMGVRLALGASPFAVRDLILRDALVLVAGGLLIGGLLLVPALSAIEKLVFGISARDPKAIGLAIGVLLASGFAASALPAWRASRVDPVTALRKE